MNPKKIVCVCIPLLLVIGILVGVKWERDYKEKKETVEDAKNKDISIVYAEAAEKEESFISVSKMLMECVGDKNILDVSNRWEDYEKDAKGENEEAFHDIFGEGKITLWFEATDGQVDAICYVYDHFSAGEKGVIYVKEPMGEKGNKYLNHYTKYGEIKKVNEYLYVYTYELPYV